jgi:Putative adhesin
MEDALAAQRRSLRLPGSARRASPWWWLVAGSAALLIVVALAMGGWWAASTENRIATYRVVGTLTTIELDLGAASLDVVGGGGGAVEVQRTERFAFDQPPTERRAVEGGVLRIAAGCPDTALGTCESAYRIVVPDNVQVNVRTSSGRVRLAGVNASASITTGSGAIAVDAFCGFALTATSESGDVRARTGCSPDRTELRSGSGVVVARVPAGRYRVDAESAGGTARVRGLVVADDASFQIQAISGGDDVLVEGGR